MSPGPVQITGGVFNATDAFGGGDSRKALLGRAEGLFPLGEDVSLGVGANVFRRETAGRRDSRRCLDRSDRSVRVI